MLSDLATFGNSFCSEILLFRLMHASADLQF